MIYFTSDWHLGHKNIIEYSKRPFQDTFEMEEQIVHNFNSIVNDGDEIWHLGDFSFYTFPATKKLFDRLNGINNIVLGNHDRSIDYMKKVGFNEVVYNKLLTINNKVLYLRHIPNHRTHDERKYKDKYLIESVESYDYFICGHVHEKWRVKDNIINVGVDQWNFKPVTLDEILNVVA